MKKKFLAYLTVFGLVIGQLGSTASAGADFILGEPVESISSETAAKYADEDAEGISAEAAAKYAGENAEGIITENAAKYEAASVSPDVESHTIAEIRAFAAEHPVKFLTPAFDQMPSLSSPYAMGKVKAENLQDGLNAVNQVRFIAGLSHNVTLDDEYIKYAQAASLVVGANGSLSHSPSKPSEMDDSLYDLGRTGAGSSNLSAGRGSIAATVINGYLNDGDNSNIKMVGHRRWVLNPKMGKTGFGIVTGGKTYGTFSAMYAFDRSGSATGTVSMWPAMKTPIEYFGNNYPWSYSTGTSEDIDKVQVTLTNVNTGAEWIFNKNTTEGYFNINNQGYGISGCIIFRPDSMRYSAGDKYHVKLTGLSKGKNVEYDVYFFELNGTDEEEIVKEVESVSISASSTTFYAGSALQLTATCLPEDAANKEVTWKSNNTGIATVDALGRVFGIREGTVKITVETVSGNKKATISLKVVNSAEDKQLVEAGSMFRLYNPNSGEHFYTGSLEERNSLVNVGWNYEGVAWRAPRISSIPVYRLYNPYVGDHHYTTSVQERNDLIAVGWLDENIAWYSDEALGVPMYRLFNPNAVTGMHHYTASVEERDHLVSLGWKYEGVGWHGLK